MSYNDKFPRLNLAVCKKLILAQIASDGGKDKTFSSTMLPIGKVYSKKGYIAKDDLIIDCIRIINGASSKNGNKSGFHYYVKECNDFHRKAYIIYFNFHLYGDERFQISFHSFNKSLEKYISYSHVTKWDKQSSRRTARKLANYYLKNNYKKQKKVIDKQ